MKIAEIAANNCIEGNTINPEKMESFKRLMTLLDVKVSEQLVGFIVAEEANYSADSSYGTFRGDYNKPTEKGTTNAEIGWLKTTAYICDADNDAQTFKLFKYSYTSYDMGYGDRYSSSSSDTFHKGITFNSYFAIDEQTRFKDNAIISVAITGKKMAEAGLKRLVGRYLLQKAEITPIKKEYRKVLIGRKKDLDDFVLIALNSDEKDIWFLERDDSFVLTSTEVLYFLDGSRQLDANGNHGQRFYILGMTPHFSTTGWNGYVFTVEDVDKMELIQVPKLEYLHLFEDNTPEYKCSIYKEDFYTLHTKRLNSICKPQNFNIFNETAEWVEISDEINTTEYALLWLNGWKAIHRKNANLLRFLTSGKVPDVKTDWNQWNEKSSLDFQLNQFAAGLRNYNKEPINNMIKVLNKRLRLVNILPL